ncbi:MAG TPA: non-homologous end-joining DNA ligase [Acidimicrobiales bacterium]|nr:non-homologous end-joining DNA ligase [Acidimicrobiales bacterium]
MAAAKPDEIRDGVPLTNLDQPLFDAAGATKRDLVDYLDGVADRLVPVLADRPLSVIRVHRGQEAFMQKNVPSYAPEWIRTITYWAETSKREVAYALCNDRRTLLWFANQRAVEFHPTLVRLDNAGAGAGAEHVTHLVLDLDPPVYAGFAAAVQAAQVVRATLDDLGLSGVVKTSGAKGVHIFVPVEAGTTVGDAAAATRAIAQRCAQRDPTIATTAFMKEDRGGKVFVDSTRAGAGTVAAAYSPRARAGTPVSFPLEWDDLASVSPADFTIHNALDLLAGDDPWSRQPPPRPLPRELVEEGAEVPSGRVEAMHEGRRRARGRRS